MSVIANLDPLGDHMVVALEDQIIETWNIHNRINLFLLDAIPAEALVATLGPRNRTVYQLFAHLHDVRLMWLKPADPALLTGLEKLDGDTGNKSSLSKAFEDSGGAIAFTLKKSLEPVMHFNRGVGYWVDEQEALPQ